MREEKPMRIFASAFGKRFYVTKSYREKDGYIIQGRGRRWDVTKDIMALLKSVKKTK